MYEVQNIGFKQHVMPNHTRHTNRYSARMQSFSMLKKLARIITTGVQSVKHLLGGTEESHGKLSQLGCSVSRHSHWH
jgi:hypothetical protein